MYIWRTRVNLVFVRKGLSAALREPTRLDWLPRDPRGISLFLPPQHKDYKYMQPYVDLFKLGF